MKRTPENTLLRKYARLVDANVGPCKYQDSTAWVSMGFDLAAAADHYGGWMVTGYRPGVGGSVSSLSEISKQYGPHVRRFLSRQRGEVLAKACALAYAYGTALEGRRETCTPY